MVPKQIDQEGIYAVIPAYNEKDTIKQVVSEVRTFTPNVVVVDDGSTDQTAKMAAEEGALTVIHSQNRGYDKSIDDGFAYVVQQKNVFAIFTFDADGQHKAEVLHALFKPLIEEKADIVVGVRPYKARIAEKILAYYTKSKYGIDDPLCGLKVYRKEVYQDIGFFDRINSIGTELLIRAKKKGYHIVQVPIAIKPRTDHSRFGQSVKGNYKIFMAFLRILLFL